MKKLNDLEEKAAWIRRIVLEAIASSGKGHIGGTYSCVELLVALYYGRILRVDSKNPQGSERDRFLIGKGHACLALYAIFVDLGFISKEKFSEYGKDGSHLGGQLDKSIPGVEYNTGSLGHVLGIGAGMALAAKLDLKKFRTYVLMGDAECYEGSVWEAVIFAAEKKVQGLTAIIDRNRLSVTEALPDDGLFKDFKKKITSFGWDYHEINGHAFGEILKVLASPKKSRKPVMIVANTLKGKGISFMENGIKWHHGVPNRTELELARKELGFENER